MGKDVKTYVMLNSCYASCILQKQIFIKAILIGILKQVDQMQKNENKISDAKVQKWQMMMQQPIQTNL